MMSLLQMSIYGAVFVLAAVAIRAAAVNILPKRTFIVLWGIALLRLIVPFSAPSAFSVYSLVYSLGSPNAEAGLPRHFSDAVLYGGGMQGVQKIQGFYETREAAPSVSAGAIIWFAGTFLCAVFFTYGYVRCLRTFRTSLPVQNAFAAQWLAEHRLKRPVCVRQSDRVSTPLTYGIFRPVILMPKGTDWENRQQLEYVLLHEYMHIRHYDAALKFAAVLALCLHWFNPAVWLLYALVNQDIELACDECVVQQSGENAKQAYAMTLISMEAKKSGLAFLCNCFGRNAIEERIRMIMKMKKYSRLAVFAAAALVCGAAVVFGTSAKNKAASGQKEQPEVQMEIKEGASAADDQGEGQQASAAEGTEGTVSVDALKVREDPDAEAKVNALLKEGQKVSILEERDGYYKVIIETEEEGDLCGYVKTDYVDIDAKELHLGP